MPVRLRIQLTGEEKKELLTLYEQEKVPKRTRQRIDILMFSDGGWGVSKIAQNLRCSEAMVRRTISRWINQEKEGLFDAPRPGRKRKWKEEDIEYLEKRGKRVNVIGALEKGKSFEYGISLSGITSETYIKFIDWQAEKAEKHFQKTGQVTVIIQDNYSVHKSQKIQEKEREWQDKKLEFFFLSAYSPELNEIEPEWHQLKAHELVGRMFEDEYDLIQAVIQAIEDRNERNNCTCQRLRFNSLSNSQELS